jgi:formate dehydrogenase maturation protein FdhE
MSWQRRIERADELAEVSPVYPEVLHFYREIAAFQAGVAEGRPANLDALQAVILRTGGDDPMHAFFERVLRQASGGRRESEGGGQSCPRCGAPPVAAVIRHDGRFLLCSTCFSEWEFRGALCPNCGGENLRFHTDGEMPHVRVEACDMCRVYVKAVDLTQDARAVPEVDELAAVVLDLWAIGHGYRKLQVNLFGM